MSAPVSSIDRVRAALSSAGFELEVQEMPTSTRTAEDAAGTIGCGVAQIVKSLVFKAERSGAPVLVLASGINQVDVTRIGELLGEPIGRADAGFVREKTGFAIGGVAPVGHIKQPVTIIDRELLNHKTVWAAAGKPNAVFSINPAKLENLTGGTLAGIS